MKILTTLLIAAVVVVLAAIGFAYSGLYDVSANSPHGGFAKWFLSTTSHASVERRASGIEVPDLDDDSLILAGANDFSSMCAGCHGAPGTKPEAVGQGLNPPAPDLAEEAAEMTPAELFWVTKNGIRMTGMPAWGVTHDDDAIWPVVAFLTNLPGLDESAYQALLAEAEGSGHHASDSADEHHSHGHGGSPSNDAAHDHGDSADHTEGDSMQPEDMPEPTDEHEHESHEH
jgi:mono/diheme cytochrome c family protein